jgi:ADP-heptose:LPS heptosyltransferase
LVVYLRGSFPFLLLGISSRFAAARFVPGEPVIDRYLRPLESMFGPIADRQPRLHVDARSSRFARTILDNNGTGRGPAIVIHATASAATKMWPAERFAALADRLVESTRARVHYLGSPADKPFLDQVAKLSAHAHTCHCSLRLPEVVAVIAASDLFIGNDSGLAHIAAAVGTRMVVLWGPVNLTMARPQAPAERCTILYHDLPCRSICPETQCVNPVHLECLMRIETNHVLDAAKRLLGFPCPPAKRAEFQAASAP